MNSTTQQLLVSVIEDKTDANEPQQAPLEEIKRKEFEQRVEQTLHYELPQVYLDVLSYTDGLDCNGVVLYASEVYNEGGEFLIQGFLEANILLRGYLPNRNFIYFAESGMDFYRHNLQNNLFEISARIGGTVFNSFDTSEKLFNQILKHMLGDYGNDEIDKTS